MPESSPSTEVLSPPAVRAIATGLGGYALVGGVVSLLGYFFNWRVLTDWFSTGISIQPNTTLAAAAAGAGVICLAWSWRKSATVLAGFVALIGLTVWFQNLTGLDLGIDTLLLFDRPWGYIATVSPGRMGLPGSTSWVLLGTGLLLAVRGPRARQLAVWLALATALLVSLSLLGYLYRANLLYSLPRYTAIALQTSTMIMAAALGLVATQADREPMRSLLERSAGGLLLRRALPFVVLLPIALGYLRTRGEDFGWFDPGMGRALLMLSFIVIMLIGVRSVARRLSERERALHQAEDRLREAARLEALGRLAGGLAHDFNNQLQGISGFASFIAADPALGPRSRGDLDQVQKGIDRIASLIRQLLAFSRKQVLKPDVVELGAAIQDSVPLLRQFVGPTVNFSVDPGSEPVWVRVDRAQLHQVLINLTINARDAMPDGGELTLAVRREGEFGRLEVTDTGQGIAPGDLPFIFEPFFTTKGVGGGTGLGLATVHGIVTQSHGQIQVRSEPGRGTRFTVLLPVTGHPAPPSDPAVAEPPPPAARARILVVDDEPMVREIMRRALETEGYQVFLAFDGREALACLEREGDMDLVLSDVVMPTMGGAELGRVLARRWPDLPVVWMSGFPQDVAFGEDRGGARQPFLAKPVHLDELLRVVSSHAKGGKAVRR